jgi:uncharacterized protein (DUF2225 family)
MADFWKDTAKCPICANEFMYSKVSSQAIMVKERDMDLKPVYKGINPLKFSLITCPHCYFSLNEKDLEDIKKEIKETHFSKIKEYLDSLSEKDMKGLDNYDTKDVGFYKKQIVIASEIYSILEKPFEVSRLLLKLSWVYREEQDEKRELKILNNILKINNKFYESATNDRDTIFLLFYNSYINYRLGERKEAAKNIEKLMRGYSKTKSPYINAAKELRGELE